MNKKVAVELARSFLIKNIELEYCSEPPGPIYNFNPEEDFLFTFQMFSGSSIGASQYLAVSKKTGTVSYIGNIGE